MIVRVFVAGGTWVLGRRLVPQLVSRGHEVTATTTSTAKLGSLQQLGADAVVMDGNEPVGSPVDVQLRRKAFQLAGLGPVAVAEQAHHGRHHQHPHDGHVYDDGGDHTDAAVITRPVLAVPERMARLLSRVRAQVSRIRLTVASMTERFVS